MSSVTANLGLTKWDSLSDFFSHSQLAANLQLIDDHDHTVGKGSRIPAGGLATASVARTNIQDNAIGAVQIENATVTDVKLASPLSGVYRLVDVAQAVIHDGLTAATYYTRMGESPVASGTPTLSSDPANSASSAFNFFRIAAADSAVASKTTKLRLTASVAVNNTAPAITITPGLYPVTVAGGADVLTPTLGSVVTNSAAALVTPGAHVFTHATSGDFTLPADGTYAVGFTTSGTPTADSRVSLQVKVELHHI